ncbi:PfkB family carbohydrate kinase [Thiohalomonas denitrificans]|uniref:Ketohexokinase n=1 Tax=Thiohalomonas denitrificans TaxID=415747 RepID=A0A1G5PK61_9GAMM|nr:PfkB family carbohydrate kinase [Thiohalomonas denitrificans]SCZ49862.1 ketohexokinase [Thiohalomonas denitrificans]
MANILGVGNATLDIINIVDGYPAEDDEVRAEAQRVYRGGNTANSLVVLSQLGHRCRWAGTLADERDARPILDDFERHHVDTAAAATISQGKVPTSYVILNKRTGSRTIVHYRDLPEYAFKHFARIDLQELEWVHFEGRNPEAVKRMLQRVKAERPELRCSLEVEKHRPGIDALFHHVDLLLFSRTFAESRGADSAESFLDSIRNEAPESDLVCAWGEQGACGLTRRGQPVATPAFVPPRVVDTLGAGDVFNAGMIDARLREQSLQSSLVAAARLAGHKCGQEGIEGLVGSG